MSALKKSTRKATAPQTSNISLAKALDTPVPEEQLNMPAGFLPNGELATLKEIIDPKIPTLSLAEANPGQISDLVAKRIELQPDFEIAMVGAGVVDKERAISEVKAQSKVGRVLMEIEQRVINNLVERATKAKDLKVDKEATNAS